MNKLIALLLIFSQAAWAGLPPTTSKGSGDANPVTTFNYQFPNFAGTHTGTTYSLGVNGVAGGGTGLSSITSHNLIIGNGTGAATLLAPSATSGQVLTSNGASSDPSFSAPTIPAQGQAGSSVSYQTIEAPANQITNMGANVGLVETGNDNVLVNPSFQASPITTGWTLAGSGVASAISTSPTWGVDPSVIKLTLTAATGDLLYQDVTGIFSGVNLEQSLWVYAPTSGVTLQVCPRLSAADVSGACVSVPNIGGWVYVPSAGSVGGAGSAGVSLFASASSTGTVYVTHGYVGRNRNLSNATPITAWSTGLSLIPNNFGTVTSATYQSRQVGDSLEVVGNFTAGTTVASIASISLPTGYTIDSTKISSSSAGTAVGYGTNVAGNASVFGTESFVIFYDGSDTSKLYFSIVTGTSAYSKANANAVVSSSAVAQFNFKIPVTQFASSVPIASLANVAQSWSGYFDNTCDWPRTSTSYGDFTADATCTLVERYNRNFGSVSAISGVLPGLNFTPSRSGRVLVVATPKWTYGASAAAIADLQLTDGTNTIAECEHQEVTSNAKVTCTLEGVMNVTSGTQATIKIQGKDSAGTVEIFGTNSTSAIDWTIVPLDNAFPQPYATGNVSSTTTGQMHIESVYFAGSTATSTCSSTCTVYGPDTSWVSSVTRTGTGTYTVNVVAGTFSATPICVPGVDFNLNKIDTYDFGGSTSTALKFDTYNSSFTLADAGAHIICMGPH